MPACVASPRFASLASRFVAGSVGKPSERTRNLLRRKVAAFLAGRADDLSERGSGADRIRPSEGEHGDCRDHGPEPRRGSPFEAVNGTLDRAQSTQKREARAGRRGSEEATLLCRRKCSNSAAWNGSPCWSFAIVVGAEVMQSGLPKASSAGVAGIAPAGQAVVKDCSKSTNAATNTTIEPRLCLASFKSPPPCRPIYTRLPGTSGDQTDLRQSAT